MKSVNIKSLFTEKDCEYILSHFIDFRKRQIYIETGEINKPYWNLNERPSQSDIPIGKELSLFLINKLKKHIPIIGFPKLVQVLNYKEGSKFEKHKDDIESNKERYLTLLIQLSDKKDYEGGSFVYYENDKKNIGHKELGSVICIRSSLWHEVTEIKKGSRDVFVVWLTSQMIKKESSIL